MVIVGASSPSFVDKMLVAVGLIYEGRYYYGRHGRLLSRAVVGGRRAASPLLRLVHGQTSSETNRWTFCLSSNQFGKRESVSVFNFDEQTQS